jgi:hypothetical protein
VIPSWNQEKEKQRNLLQIQTRPAKVNNKFKPTKQRKIKNKNKIIIIIVITKIINK